MNSKQAQQNTPRRYQRFDSIALARRATHAQRVRRELETLERSLATASPMGFPADPVQRQGQLDALAEKRAQLATVEGLEGDHLALAFASDAISIWEGTPIPGLSETLARGRAAGVSSPPGMP